MAVDPLGPARAGLSLLLSFLLFPHLSIFSHRLSLLPSVFLFHRVGGELSCVPSLMVVLVNVLSGGSGRGRDSGARASCGTFDVTLVGSAAVCT